MNNFHQQSPKENIESKCKNTTHLKTKKNGVLQKFPAKRRLGEEEDLERKRKRERRESAENFISSSLI